MKRCAGLIIRNSEGEYLLQMRDDTPGIVCPLMWDFFGGGVEKGEDLMTAAAREMQEELGIVANGDLEASFAQVARNVEENLFLLKRPVEWGDFRVFEGAGAGFFTPEEALKLHAAPLVQDYFKSIV